MKTMLSNPEIYTYPSSVPLEPRDIVDQVVIIPNLIKQDQYNRLGDYLVEELNYQRGVDFFEFAYDWRQDVRISVKQLAQLVKSLPDKQPIVVIAHSLGTIIMGNIYGSDGRLNPLLVPSNQPNLQAGQQLNILFGLNFVIPEGFLKGQRLGVEGGIPVYQWYDGPQLKQQYQIWTNLTLLF